MARNIVGFAKRSGDTERRRPSGRARRGLGVAIALAMASAPLVAVDLVSSAPAGAASATPIVILDMCSCTGPLASSAQQTGPTLTAWASSVNAKGGLNGHKVQMIVKDDLTTPSVAIGQVQKAITDDHVAAILDNSNVDTDWASIAEAAGVPIIGAADSAIDYNSTDVFTPGPTLNYGITGQALGMSHLTKYKTEAILYCVESPACSQETAIAGQIDKRYGLSLVYNAGISFSSPNYTAQCLAAKQSGAKVFEIADATTIVEKAAADCATQGYSPVEIAAATASNMATIPQFEGMISSQQEIPYFVHNAATKAYDAALAKYSPNLHLDPNYGEQSVIAWAEGVLLHDAVVAAAPSSGTTVTAAVVKKGLYHLPAGDNLGGIAPQAISFTKGVPANRNCWMYISVKNGKFSWANNQQPICGALIKAGANEGSPLLKPTKISGS